MIKVLYIKGVYGPIIRCDVCGERITNAGLAAVLRKTAMLAEGQESEVFHVHKGRCHDTMEGRLGGAPGWDEITNHFLNLLLNAGSSPAKLREIQKIHDEVGEL